MLKIIVIVIITCIIVISIAIISCKIYGAKKGIDQLRRRKRKRSSSIKKAGQEKVEGVKAAKKEKDFEVNIPPPMKISSPSIQKRMQPLIGNTIVNTGILPIEQKDIKVRPTALPRITFQVENETSKAIGTEMGTFSKNEGSKKGDNENQIQSLGEEKVPRKARALDTTEVGKQALIDKLKQVKEEKRRAEARKKCVGTSKHEKN